MIKIGILNHCKEIGWRKNGNEAGMYLEIRFRSRVEDSENISERGCVSKSLESRCGSAMSETRRGDSGAKADTRSQRPAPRNASLSQRPQKEKPLLYPAGEHIWQPFALRVSTYAPPSHLQA